MELKALKSKVWNSPTQVFHTEDFIKKFKWNGID